MSKKNLPTIAGVTVAAVLVVLAVLWLVSGMSVQAKTRNALSRKTKNSSRTFPVPPHLRTRSTSGGWGRVGSW